MAALRLFPALSRFCTALLLSSMTCAAHSATEVRILETDPPTPATLGRDQSLYVRMAYTSDEPVSIWARPYFQGKEVTRTKSNASFPRQGKGEALGWFSLDGAGEVDEIRIRTGGGKPYAERELLQLPVQITVTSEPATAPAKAAWVTELLRADEALAKQAYEQRMREPVSTGDTALFSAFMLAALGLLVGGFAAPAWGVWKWHGGWRVAVLAPALLLGFVVLRIVVDTARDPTSHNLWPFEILMAGTVSVVIVGVLALVRRLRKPAA